MTLHPVSGDRVGILLVNLGTPDAPTPSAIRRYLREFLSDRRVVELPRLIWLPILHGLVLPLRPRRLAHTYQQVWLPDGSPLLVHSQRLAERLEAESGLPVRLAMRYGNPSLNDGLDALMALGVERLLVIPMYPQYSATTTASVIDGLAASLANRRRLPALLTVGDYHDHPAYIDALAGSVQAHWSRHGRADHLLMSFHGIPQHCVDAGDPYQAQCLETARRLAAALGLTARDHSVSFQSRFGRTEWLRPYTDARIRELGTHTASLDVICPGFPADCLETLEEIAIQNRDLYVESGGERLHYIPALNADDAQVALYHALLRDTLGGWPRPD